MKTDSTWYDPKCPSGKIWKKIQYQAAPAVTGTWQGSCRSKLYEELGWESLSDRRWCSRILYMSSFFPDAITSWNNVVTHCDDIPSFNVLKKHILSLMRPKKKSIFGVHDPLGLRYLFQLRVGLSSFRYDKNAILIPLLINVFINQGIEDNNHFLFLSSFATRRATSAIDVIAIL